MTDSEDEIPEEELPAKPELPHDDLAASEPEPTTLPIRSALDLSGLIPNFSALIAPAIPDFTKHIREQMTSAMPDLTNLNTRIFPAISMAGVMPALDAALLDSLAATTSNFASLMPDLSAMASLKLPKYELPNLSAAFSAILEQLRNSLPPNWPSDVDEHAVLAVVQDEGIPLVWVPRAEIVDAVLGAADRNARLELLVEYQQMIVDDCREVLAAMDAEGLSGQVPLASKAVEALASDHFEAAQALAVVVTETAVAQSISGKYEVVKKQVLFDPQLVPYGLLRLHAALAPIGRFYTSWWASSGDPKPQELSRHVSVHHADAGHYTEANAVIAVMLVTSVLRALQELQEVAAASEEDAA